MKYVGRNPLKFVSRPVAGISVAALLLGGGYAAYSVVVGSAEYKLAIAATNTFRHPGYNVATSVRVTPELIDAIAPGSDWASSGLPGVESSSDVAAVINQMGVVFARGSGDALNPVARFAITYGTESLLDVRSVNRVVYVKTNPAVLARGARPLLPPEALKPLRAELRKTVIGHNRQKGIRKAQKTLNSRTLQLFDGMPVAMNFAAKTSVGKKWNAMARPSGIAQVAPQQSAIQEIIAALRNSIAGRTSVTDEADDAIGDKMSVSIDVRGLMADLKPQLLALGQAQSAMDGSEWDADQQSASFDEDLSSVSSPLELQVWLKDDYIRRIEVDATSVATTDSPLAARSLVVRMTFSQAAVAVPKKYSLMAQTEANLLMRHMGSTSSGFLQGAAGGLPFPLRAGAVMSRASLPSVKELTVHTKQRGFVWRSAAEAFLQQQR